jgi:hypothetical protein
VWIACRYGFYSVASALRLDGSVDPDVVMVRARRVGHPQELQYRFAELRQSDIIELPGRDYRYRLVMPKALWVAVLSALAAEQEWTNFKDEVARFKGQWERNYIDCLHDVWAIMRRLQRELRASAKREHQPEQGGLGTASS